MSIISKTGAVFFDFIETIVIALSIFLVVYLFFMQPHQVNGQSMVPNFQSGEYLLTDKVTYRMRNPERGEVMVFHAPQSAHCAKGTGCDFIKRILAVPGESVEVKNNGIYVNGDRLAESYIPDSYETLAGEFSRNRVINLGANEYFVSGDNRPYSSDSRAWGPIKKEDIVGRVFYRYWPIKAIGKIVKADY
ncbi:MAG: signal peptidase I [Candidatus Pacebacteria bacterium]|jgi:signal peptidase I|nr:signal peptidase I [Candidatus Paceibacterota bacterium]MBT3512072.1 signal peptidase I [Candidatus Paceibacterota bacterium]MBT4004813.1 signal peptidase I [Candidatus Paceibacterota bacterium]MBT4358480.1 signal peptidase I [Candidatus Paceibacterota bacterium]MBT4681264.1 signal peptidase I [Candidatus Paceibacterota bacterium]